MFWSLSVCVLEVARFWSYTIFLPSHLHPIYAKSSKYLAFKRTYSREWNNLQEPETNLVMPLDWERFLVRRVR